ncbi:four-carbon acid sugar kinase family protein [Nocardiopsis rhodophaea]|uniref:four-carbon acid sugar kinase family protein n=1 Tax=Nocardiopsis rhodophaea TaxID=280238 RepID=UPI0031E2E5C3
MVQVLVVADDLTGATATGARFARTGMRVATVTPEHVSAVADEYDVVVANLDSRHLPPEQASDLVTDVVEAVWPVGLVVKRTDTTLRGNVGAEVEAAWRAVRERVSAETPVRALMVPAFPASGRITVDGVQLLNGVPLDHTELASDPFCPMTTADVTAILGWQTDLAVRHVPMRQVTRTLLTADLVAGDEPVVLCDALEDRHLEDIAEAAAEAHRRDGTVWVAVDPGPTSALLAYALRLRGQAGSPGPLLAVAGTNTGLTSRQLDTVARIGPARFVDFEPARLADPKDDHFDDVARTLTDHLTSAIFPEVVILRGTVPQEREGAPAVPGIPVEARRRLPQRLAELVAEVIHDVAADAGTHALPSGLYLVGADVTSSLLDELGVHSLAVGGEVVPLTVHGTLSGGPLDGAPIVTKGGLVGDDTTAVECLRKLRRSAQARLQQVRSEVSEHVVPTGAPSRL